MEVTLIDYTGKGNLSPDHAIDLLIFTKSTRLKMEPGLLEEISWWPWEKKLEELRYMANTIPSSWEFVDFTFLISGVTRAFTHQLVRTRTASFAQQTMRVLDVSEGRGWDYGTGPTIDDDSTEKDPTGSRGQIYDTVMADIDDAYKELISLGVKIEDARGILPTNILTNIVVKMNLRTFCEMSRKRASSRTQGEYRAVIEEMQKAVRKALPWATIFMDRSFDRAASELEQEIISLPDLSDEKRTQLIKLIDQLRMTA